MSGRRLQDHTLPPNSDHVLIPELSWGYPFKTEALETGDHVHLIFIETKS